MHIPHLLAALCGCYTLLFSPSSHLRWWVPLFHMPNDVCGMSLANDCRVLSPHYWECMEHNRQWVTCTSHIFLWHYVVVIHCCCLLPPTSGCESHSSTCPNDVCGMSLANDCHVLSPHYYGCMEHNRKWVTCTSHIFLQHYVVVIHCWCLLPPTSGG